MFDAKLIKTAERILQACVARKIKLTTAESCTGGLVAAVLTEIPGSSEMLDRSFVTYSNEAKQQMLGVSALTLQRYGAVSRQTASAMARGALANSNAEIAVAITGVAGPGGGTAKKPVGLVQFYAVARDGRKVRREKRFGKIGRHKVRIRSVAEALAMLELLASGGRI